MKKIKMILLVFACVFLVISGGFIFNADIFIGSVLSVETSKKTEEPVIDFDDSVYTEENWKDKPSEGFAGGNGTKDNPYQISNAAEFAYFQVSRKNNKHFVLTKDIYLNDGYFEDDGTYHDGGDGVLNKWNYNNTFYGTLDGQGFSICGLYAEYYGLFLEVSNVSQIYNLHIRRGYVNAKVGNAGGFCTNNKGIIENCLFDGVVSSTKENSANYGGICGSNYGKIINCVNYGKILGAKGSLQMGGITGVSSETIQDCVNYGEVGSYTSSHTVGGIAGKATYEVIKNCVNYGKIRAGSHLGGIVGFGIASYCTNYGDVIGTNRNIGGIAGLTSDTVLVKSRIMRENKNYGYVMGSSYTGNVVGFGRSVSIIKCENYGPEKGAKALVYYLDSDCMVLDCANTTTATICGYAKEGVVIKNCVSSGITNNPKNTIITTCLTDNVYNCISCATNSSTGELIKQIYATDLSQFSLNFKTGKIVLNKLNATGAHMGRVDRELLLSQGYEILR